MKHVRLRMPTVAEPMASMAHIFFTIGVMVLTLMATPFFRSILFFRDDRPLARAEEGKSVTSVVAIFGLWGIGGDLFGVR
jgi:hypothetical protein